MTLSASETQTTGDGELDRSGSPQTAVPRVVRPAPDRYRNPFGRYKVNRSAACVGCGKCAAICPAGVHVKPDGYKFTPRPRDQYCVGPACSRTDHYCVDHCPAKALAIGRNSSADCVGDPRWPSELILATWHEAATGHVPGHLEYRCGASGGGFDRIGINFPDSPPAKIAPEQVDTGLDLNKPGDNRPNVHIDIPV